MPNETRSVEVAVEIAAPAETWQCVLNGDAFTLSPKQPSVEQPYRAEVSTGDQFDGIVRHHVPDRDFTGTVRALDDGIFRIGTHRVAGQTGIQNFIATYDARYAPEVAAVGKRAQKLLDGLFAAPH